MECPVCFEVFEAPLLLPGCGHTICRACATELITEHNFLRCPECRLVYQLRQGIKSLPKNVALERTIEEHVKTTARMSLMCAEHPDDAIALYCKTCEKSICLKCYFAPGDTLARKASLHSGHKVDTSEDAFTKEKRLMEDRRRVCEDRRKKEAVYVTELEEATVNLKLFMESKTASIEKNKNEAIAQIKQTSGKLKFTLKGSVARDLEFLQMSLTTAKDRLNSLEVVLDKASALSIKSIHEDIPINDVKDVRKNMEELREPADDERPRAESFLKVANFDTDLQACLDDPKKALSYQTEPPRNPEILLEECVISSQKAYIQIHYDEAVRVKQLLLRYKESIYKGLSEKQWETADFGRFSRGQAQLVLKDLIAGTMYRMFAVAVNDFGESPPSTEVRFRTVDAEVDIRKT